jgi:hypothetical protein
MIKRIIRNALRKVGYCINRIKETSNEQANELRQAEEIIERGKAIIQKVSPNFQVLNGPFKALKYPSIDITEATLVPKIIGSYEAQLHPVIHQIINTPYTDVLDIGCAEGYYAVGFASCMPDTIIHCFDINEKDLNFCRTMAKVNNLDNLTYNTECNPATLTSFNFKGHSLIFCDCEGYELELFSTEVIDKLRNVDVLVELHDVVNPVISSQILTRFQHTHNLHVVNNLNVDRSQLQRLELLSKEDKEFAVYEHRGGLYQNIFMEWAFLTSK